MNKRTAFRKILVVVMCVACVISICTGYQARAATGEDYPIVSNADQFLQAIADAEDGDTIGISGEINFYEGVTIGYEDKRVTVIRESEDAYVYFSGIGSYTIKNIVFDGNSIECRHSIVYSANPLTVEDCDFQNCIADGCGGAVFDAERLEFYRCTFKNNSTNARGGHVEMGAGLFDACVLIDGNAKIEGGAVACSVVDFQNCIITNNYAGLYGGGIYTAGLTTLSGTKLYNNTVGGCGADYISFCNEICISESIEELAILYKDDGLYPERWEVENEGSLTGGKLIFGTEPTIEPEIPSIPDESEPELPTDPIPDDSTEEKPKEDDSETEPNEPTEDKPEETLPSDDKDNVSDQQPEESTPSNPNTNNSTVDNSSTTGNITTDNSSTDNSTNSNHESTTTDNSRYSNTTDSNNTSTINNNYYTQPETQTSNNQPEVQTIVVPVGNTGNDEPLQQTITIQGSPEGKSSEGMTLNVNVNIGSEDAADQEKSIIEQSGASWYQVAVLCLLSLILGCVIKRR